MQWIRICALGVGIVGALCSGACNSHEDVPATECGKVVSHARKLLGDRAESSSKMMADCKAADGQQRGCAMAAASPAALLRCSM